MRTCKRCGVRASEEWFTQNYRNKGLLTNLYKRSFCPMCLQELRDAHKKENRAVPKARMMIYSHAKKYGTGAAEFARKYGWNVRRIAHDINHTYENSCFYCGTPYIDMGNGLRDITLDIINPEDELYYTNTRLCCSTCNTTKGRRGAEMFGFHTQKVRERAEYIEAQPGTEKRPQYQMDSLF